MRRTGWGAAALLVALTAATYLPVARAGTVWDDDAHVTNNPALRDLRGLVAVWTTLDATPQYYPLTHTTFWIEYRLWGLNPLGYHVVNVLLHAASAVVLWRLLLLLEVPGAWLAACVFAVHPVHVESVAWITERKNVLSGLLALLAASAFLNEALREGGRLRPWRTALPYAGALLAKTVTATVPVAIGLVVWWKRGRLRAGEIGLLAPMLAAGAVLGSITRHLETTQIRASGSEWSLSLPDRLVLAGRVPWFYLGKLLWPASLSFVYPRWVIDASDPRAWGGLAAGVAVALALFLARGRIGRGPFVSVAVFVVLLAPALGFFNVYPMRYAWVADHFQYLASIAPIALACALAAASAVAAARRWPAIRRAALVAAAAVVVALAVRAHARCFAFADEETLWRDTLARNPAAWIAHDDLGILLARRGALAEAEEHFRAVLALKPDHAGAAANLGYALELSGRDEEAAQMFAHAIEGAPGDGNAHAHLARCLVRLRRTGEALPYAVLAARLLPTDPDVLCDAGSLLASAGRFDEAIVDLRHALALRADFPRAKTNLEIALKQRDGVSSGAPRGRPDPEVSR